MILSCKASAIKCKYVIINSIRHTYQVMLRTSVLNIEHKIHASSRGYDSVIRRMLSWVCLLYNLYNTNEFILRMTWCHVKNELIGVV